LLHAFCEQYSSQKKACEVLKNVAEATVINMRKGNWDNISDEMWRNVGSQVGYSKTGGWNVVQTTAFKTLTAFFKDAQTYSNVYAVVAPAGAGKTKTADHYAKNNRNAFHLTCAEYFNRKMFLTKLGKEDTGYNVSEMMDYVVELLRKMETPILILDEADKLNDQVLYFFITLYNMLEGKCAIILMATEFLQKRVLRGVKLNKKGYAEIHSRLGKRFLTISVAGKSEVAEICKANGVEDSQAITEIYNESEGDLRRVERAVHKYIKLQTN